MKSLMYATLITWSDISYVVTTFCYYNLWAYVLYSVTANSRKAMSFSQALELLHRRLISQGSLPSYLLRLSSLTAQWPLNKCNGYFHYRKTFNAKTYHCCQSTTIVSILSLEPPWESSKLELSPLTFACKTVKNCTYAEW
jgi:hypothetical protein